MILNIFLASSSELEDDRREFESFIARKNNDWISRGLFLKLVIWEDFLDAMSKTRLQDEYNKAVREADIFVMLFCTKVGKYTEEEFNTAFRQFKATGKPLIFTYFKDIEISISAADKTDLTSLWAFQQTLRRLGHFQSVYKNTDALKFQFGQQLEKLTMSGFIKFETDEDRVIAAESVSSATNLTGDTATAPSSRAMPINPEGADIGGKRHILKQKEVDTGGGAYISGSVNVHTGDFVGRDKKEKKP